MSARGAAMERCARCGHWYAVRHGLCAGCRETLRARGRAHIMVTCGRCGQRFPEPQRTMSADGPLCPDCFPF